MHAEYTLTNDFFFVHHWLSNESNFVFTEVMNYEFNNLKSIFFF